MIFRFNTAQLGPKMENALNSLFAGLQKTQTEEIEVIADEFPEKLIVKTADGIEAKIAWDADEQCYRYVGEPLPAFSPDPDEKVGEVKEWQRPEKSATSPEPEPAQAPEPAPEIKVTVDGVVSQFMVLLPEQRTAFFCEAWKSISEEK